VCVPHPIVILSDRTGGGNIHGRTWFFDYFVLTDRRTMKMYGRKG